MSSPRVEIDLTKQGDSSKYLLIYPDNNIFVNIYFLLEVNDIIMMITNL